MDVPQAIAETLDRYGQRHLIRWWTEIDADRRESLAAQLERIDFPLMQSLIAMRDSDSFDESARARAARAEPPASLVRLPRSPEEAEQRRQAADRGLDLLRQGRAAAVMVAGGQGTRLGFDRPKGMYRIGPISRKSLFQLHCEQLLALSRRVERGIPYFIMTSEATHAPTVQFFREHDRFGLPPENVFFFQQGALPAVNDASPRMLLAAKHRVSTSPDGHGGLLKALRLEGMFQTMRDRGLEHLYYHQVDNPTAILCDPAFLGLHVEHGSQVSTKVVAKQSADEKMGAVVSIDGRTEIIEYSDLPPAAAGRTDEQGALLLWAGNTAMHVFDRSFLERVSTDESLAYHIAHRRVPHIGEDGELVIPDGANAHKFEQFIFDALPLAERTLVVEADRAREYNAVKNARGPGSPETARAGLLRNARALLDAAGFDVAPETRVEISPLFAAAADELRARLAPGARFDADVVLE